jgi:CRISPR/Cas system endoribonuclease Cas6 (RAMP superfamily)
VSVSKLYYNPKGALRSKTPVFLNTKKIETEDYLKIVEEKIRENILFRYLKLEFNSNNDLDFLRKNVIKNIKVNPKYITIPFASKRLKSGSPLLYHCVHVGVEFEENDVSKEIEKTIYSSGLGLNTSNGFGYME